MNLTFKELERKAYMEGDTEKAVLCALIEDQQQDIEDLEEELYDDSMAWR